MNVESNFKMTLQSNELEILDSLQLFEMFKSRLYPEDLPSSDRITQQLMYTREENFSGPHKKILMWNGMVSWGGVDTGQQEFIKQGCPVNR